MMSHLLPVFAYGTLRRGHGNHSLLDGGLTAVHEARLPGHCLYSAGLPYIAEAGRAAVAGDLLVIAPGQYTGVLARLDRLEGFVPPDGGLYVRVARPVLFRPEPDGPWQEGAAWVYHGGSHFDYRDDLLVAGGGLLGAPPPAPPRQPGLPARAE